MISDVTFLINCGTALLIITKQIVGFSSNVINVRVVAVAYNNDRISSSVNFAKAALVPCQRPL